MNLRKLVCFLAILVIVVPALSLAQQSSRIDSASARIDSASARIDSASGRIDSASSRERIVQLVGWYAGAGLGTPGLVNLVLGYSGDLFATRISAGMWLETGGAFGTTAVANGAQLDAGVVLFRSNDFYLDLTVSAQIAGYETPPLLPQHKHVLAMGASATIAFRKFYLQIGALPYPGKITTMNKLLLAPVFQFGITSCSFALRPEEG